MDRHVWSWLLIGAGALLIVLAVFLAWQSLDAPEADQPIVGIAEASATPTRTPTRTPRPTATSAGTATSTPTRTATPAWPVINCPAITPNVNATLSEWSAVTPIVLSAAGGTAIVQPASPTPAASTPQPGGPTATPQPLAADLSATFYCGRAGNTLYFAGVILDDAVSAGTTYRTVGRLSGGDSVRLTLDGREDGLSVPAGRDDHDLYIAPNGRVLDYDIYPANVSIATAANAGGWQFELALSASQIGKATLSSGTVFGLIWSLQDDDDGTGLQHIITDTKRRATLP